MRRLNVAQYWMLTNTRFLSLHVNSQFASNWTNVSPSYPLNVAEAQGAMIGNDLVVVSGFRDKWTNATAQTYARTVTSSGSNWRRMDDLPVPQGISHGSFVVVGQKFYMCGGYLGGSPGPHTSYCLVYNHAQAPGSGRQWSFLASLPDNGRGGGGLVYDSGRNALYFAGGAQRPNPGQTYAVDKNTTWMYSLDNPAAGWVAKAPIPFTANHMSFVTAKDATGRERHYFLGGQRGESECCGNVVDNYEWDAGQEKWIQRASMAMARGHAASSTRPIGCGFLIAAGAINSGGGGSSANANGSTRKTPDVSYYDASTDQWTSMGRLTQAINTPVCDIGTDGYLYCESGHIDKKFSWRRGIRV
jgi:hypothetical protein